MNQGTCGRDPAQSIHDASDFVGDGEVACCATNSHSIDIPDRRHYSRGLNDGELAADYYLPWSIGHAVALYVWPKETMTAEMPSNIEEYKQWLREKQNVLITTKDETYYGLVTQKAKADFEKSKFWVSLLNNLEAFSLEYTASSGYPLMPSAELPTILVKSFNSLLLKTYRKNVLENSNWPNEPPGGWLLPSNWLSKINDIVRTLMIVKYLDAIEFLVGKIQILCNTAGLSCAAKLEAREEGYYAAHVYLDLEFEVPRTTWDTERVHMKVEIQLTTQLQEVIRRLLHRYYEERRTRPLREETNWQWDYRSDEFSANYLGHVLHYVEGMIVEIRERQRKVHL
jgi:hypothetical protein